MRPTRQEAQGAAGPVSETRGVLVALPVGLATRLERVMPGCRLDGAVLAAVAEMVERLEREQPAWHRRLG